MKFKDLPKLTSKGNYEVSMPLLHAVSTITRWEKDEFLELQLNPDFQRGHVWSEEQQVSFIEYLLKGVSSSNVIF